MGFGIPFDERNKVERRVCFLKISRKRSSVKDVTQRIANNREKKEESGKRDKLFRTEI